MQGIEMYIFNNDGINHSSIFNTLNTVVNHLGGKEHNSFRYDLYVSTPENLSIVELPRDPAH